MSGYYSSLLNCHFEWKANQLDASDCSQKYMSSSLPYFGNSQKNSISSYLKLVLTGVKKSWHKTNDLSWKLIALNH